MKSHSYTGRLVKAGRIPSASEVQMLELFRSQSKLNKEDRDKKVCQTARSIFNGLPKAIKSLYRN